MQTDFNCSFQRFFLPLGWLFTQMSQGFAEKAPPILRIWLLLWIQRSVESGQSFHLKERETLTGELFLSPEPFYTRSKEDAGKQSQVQA